MKTLPIIATTLAIIGLAAGAYALVVVLKAQPQPLGGSLSAATFAENQASSTNATVSGSASSTALLALNARVSFWSICNLSTSTVFLSFTSPAAVNTGIILNPQASTTNTCYQMNYPSVDNGNIYAITSPSSTALVAISTGRGL